MKRQVYLIVIALFCLLNNTSAAVGDTTWVQSFNGQLTHPGNFDTSVVFPNTATTYRKVYMIFTLGEYNCPNGSQYCHQWDYTVQNYVMTPGGDTLELSRFITPYATSGTPGYGASWKQHYIFDVTDYYPILRDSATMRVAYSGYSYGFTGDVKFAFIEGTPERNVLGHDKLWNASYTYGNLASVIDSSVLPYTLTPPIGTQSAEMKLAITGHGSDQASGCCEFDNSGVGHSYYVVANNNVVGQYNMNVNCGVCELYPQGGTWAAQRAGNWCPGGLVSLAQYKLTGVTAGSPYTVDLNFDDSYDGTGSYGIYTIGSSVFYYGGYNKTVDASMEDVIAPTNFEWYRRENPRASIPVIKVRNTGGTIITSVLIQYGVKDSAMSQYIWVGSLAPSHDTIISLPASLALTNLSMGYAAGTYGFIAQILKVNGQSDNDPSNDTITSTFSVAPTWPPQFSVNIRTSSVDANGNLGSGSSAISDASWVIKDQNNVVVASHSNANCITTYKDTINLLSQGFYSLTISTSQCVGLQWWVFEQPAPNNTPGYSAGSFSVWDVNNQVNIPLNGNNGSSGSYHDDFGCGFTQYFTTTGQCQSNTPTISRNGDTLIASSGISYKWYKDGILIHGATNQTYGMTASDGNYTVDVTDINGCIGASSSYPVINLGLTSLYDQAYVRIVPNPATDVFTLSVNSELIGSSYTISDYTGRSLISGSINKVNTSVSVSGISSGVYMVTVTDGVSSITKRIAVAK